MSLTTLSIPKRNQVNLTFTGPWQSPPDNSPRFSTWSSWGSALGNGYSRIISAGYSDVRKIGGVWEPYYYIDIVNSDNTFYGAYHFYTTGSTSAYIVDGTGAFVTDDALNLKIIGINSPNATANPIGMISVDLTAGSVIDGGGVISITLNNDGYINAQTGVIPRLGFEKFSTGFGVSWLSPSTGGVPANDGYYAITDETDTHYHAFENDADYFLSRRWSHNTTDGTWNYTVVSGRPKSDSGPYIQLYKWQPEAVSGGFTQTNYALQLADPTDDALFQDFVVFTPGKLASLGPGTEDYAVSVMTNNQNTQISGGVLADANLVQQTMFCFAPDFSWYDRIDITSDGTLTQGFVFKDLLGNYYLGGTDDTNALYSPSSDTPIVGGTIVRAWTFTLAGHDYYVLRLGTDSTLVFDLYSEEWVEWTDAMESTWRAQCGINWSGGQALASTYGSNVLVGDDTLGLLWFLDPRQAFDQSPDPDAPVQQIFFPRIIQGQVVMTGRQVQPCYACWLTTDMGAPAYGGAGVKLEISDDAGVSYQDMGTITVTPGDAAPELSWYSLGQIQAPGRLFKFTDDGAVARIDNLEMNDPSAG